MGGGEGGVEEAGKAGEISESRMLLQETESKRMRKRSARKQKAGGIVQGEVRAGLTG